MIIGVTVGTFFMFQRIGQMAFMTRSTGQFSVFVLQWKTGSGMVEIRHPLDAMKRCGGMTITTRLAEFINMHIGVTFCTTFMGNIGKFLELNFVF